MKKKKNRFLAGMVVGVLVTAILVIAYWRLSEPFSRLYSQLVLSRQAEVEAIVARRDKDLGLLVAIDQLSERVSALELAPAGGLAVVESQDPAQLAADTWGQGFWEILEFDLDNDPIVAAWLRELRDPAPELWATYPNVPNPEVSDFNVANGVEYGQDNAPFCQQDERCDLIVPAWHYRLVTGDYQFQDFSCDGADGQGCLLLLVNVMDQSYTWRDQMVDNGFTVTGRFWNGDELDWAVWGLVSHASANMLGMSTLRNPNTGDVLNAGTPGNAGSNCGTPSACSSVDATVVVHAGDRILAVAKTVVRP